MIDIWNGKQLDMIPDNFQDIYNPQHCYAETGLARDKEHYTYIADELHCLIDGIGGPGGTSVLGSCCDQHCATGEDASIPEDTIIKHVLVILSNGTTQDFWFKPPDSTPLAFVPKVKPKSCSEAQLDQKSIFLTECKDDNGCFWKVLEISGGAVSEVTKYRILADGSIENNYAPVGTVQCCDYHLSPAWQYAGSCEEKYIGPPIDCPEAKLGLTIGSFIEHEPAAFLGGPNGLFVFEIKLSDKTGNPLAVALGNYVSLLFTDQANGRVLASICAPVGADLSQAIVAAGQDPMAITGNEVIDKDGSFFGGAHPFKNYFVSPSLITDGGFIYFQKGLFAEDHGQQDEKALVIRVTGAAFENGEGCASSYTTIGKGAIEELHGYPYYLDFESQVTGPTGDRLHVNTDNLNAAIRLSFKKDHLKTIDPVFTSGSLGGICCDYIHKINGRDRIWINLSFPTYSDIYRAQWNGDSYDSPALILPNAPRGGRTLKFSGYSAHIFQGEGLLIKSGLPDVSFIFWTGSTYEYRTLNFPGGLGHLIVDPTDGNIYGIWKFGSTEYRLVRIDAGRTNLSGYDEPAPTFTVLANFVFGSSQDGIGDLNEPVPAGMNAPRGMAFGPIINNQRSLYLVSRGDHSLRHITSQTGSFQGVGDVRIDTVFGGIAGNQNGVISQASLNQPQDIAAFPGSIARFLITDSANHQIKELNIIKHPYGYEGNIETYTGDPLGLAGFQDSLEF